MNIHEYIENYRYGKDVNYEWPHRFKYYDFEIDFINHIHENRFSIIKKSRQMHATTLLANYVAWQLLHNKNSITIMYMSNMLHMSQRFIELVDKSIKYFTNEIGMPVDEYNSMFRINSRKEINMANGNRVKGLATSKEALRGFTSDLIIFDEAAFINEIDILISSLLPTLSTGGKMIMVSTPNGLDEGFYETWKQSLNEKNTFKRMEIDWTDNPRYDKEWFDKKCRSMNMDERMIEQELWGQFIKPFPKNLRIGLVEPKFSPDAYAIPRKPYIPIDYIKPKLKKVLDNSFKGRLLRIFSFLRRG